jgi:hypothetical protein
VLALAVPDRAAQAAATVASALQLTTTEAIDAMLDVNLVDAVYPVAEELTRRGVPFIFIIGYCDEQLIRDFGDRPTLPKPFRRLDLNASCRCHSPRSRRALNLFARGYIGATELKFGPRRAPALASSKPSVAE